MKTVSFGDVVDPLGVTRFKGRKDVPGIVSIISEDIKVAFMHYEEGIGYFYCFSEICCERLGLPSVKYIIPIIEYTLRDVQEFEYSSPIFVKYISLTQERYEDLLKKDKILRRQNRSIFDVDLIVTCSDEVYQKITIDILDASLWRREESLVEEVKGFINTFNRIIEFSVGRKMDSSTYQTLISNLDSTFRPEPQVGQSVGQSVGKSVGKSVGQSVGQSVGKSVSKSVGQSVGKSVGQSVPKADTKSVTASGVSSAKPFVKAGQATTNVPDSTAGALSDRKATKLGNDLESIDEAIEEPIVDLNDLLESSDDLE